MRKAVLLTHVAFKETLSGYTSVGQEVSFWTMQWPFRSLKQCLNDKSYSALCEAKASWVTMQLCIRKNVEDHL